MGFVSDAVGGLFGSGSDAPRQAAGAQTAAVAEAQKAARQSGRAAISEAKKFGGRAVNELRHFEREGAQQLASAEQTLNDQRKQVTKQERRADSIVDFANSPDQQLSFLTDNPVFDALKSDAQQRLFNNQAAQGKVGSGGTAEALQNSFLLLGNDLINQDVNRKLSAFSAGSEATQLRGQEAAGRLNFANLGLNAAQGIAGANLATGSNVSRANLVTGQTIADLATQGGNAQAAGIIGEQNAKTDAFGNLVNTGLGIAGLFGLSDMRAKENILRVGTTNAGLPVYTFTYLGDDRVQMGVMAQEAEQMFPDAVIEHDGVKYVNYSEVA